MLPSYVVSYTAFRLMADRNAVDCRWLWCHSSLFVLRILPARHMRLIMIDAGQVMQAIEANPEDKTKCTLIFSNVTEEDILLRKEFESLQKKNPDQFKVDCQRGVQRSLLTCYPRLCSP